MLQKSLMTHGRLRIYADW